MLLPINEITCQRKCFDFFTLSGNHLSKLITHLKSGQHLLSYHELLFLIKIEIDVPDINMQTQIPYQNFRIDKVTMRNGVILIGHFQH